MITSRQETPLYALEDLSKIITFLPKGNWLGIIKILHDRLYVISTEGNGWINKNDAEETNKYKFKVYHNDSGYIQYKVV